MLRTYVHTIGYVPLLACPGKERIISIHIPRTSDCACIGQLSSDLNLDSFGFDLNFHYTGVWHASGELRKEISLVRFTLSFIIIPETGCVSILLNLSAVEQYHTIYVDYIPTGYIPTILELNITLLTMRLILLQ